MPASTPKTAILWLRRDLRLADNPALAAALARCERVVPVYIHAPDEEAPWEPGGAARWWLHHSLTALAADLALVADDALLDAIDLVLIDIDIVFIIIIVPSIIIFKVHHLFIIFK